MPHRVLGPDASERAVGAPGSVMRGAGSQERPGRTTVDLALRRAVWAMSDIESLNSGDEEGPRTSNLETDRSSLVARWNGEGAKEEESP